MNVVDFVQTSSLSELFSYFIPGVVFTCVYSKAFLKKFDYASFTLWSISASFIIKSFVDLVLLCLPIESVILSALSYICYLLVGIIAPVSLMKICQKSKVFAALEKSLGITLFSDIWMTVIDYTDDSCHVTVHLEDGQHFIGDVRTTGKDWLTLAPYVGFAYREDGAIEWKEESSDEVLCLPIERISHFEVGYGKADSLIKQRFYPKVTQ